MKKTIIAIVALIAVCVGCRNIPPPAPEPEPIPPPYMPVVNTVENTEKHHPPTGVAYTQVQLDGDLSRMLSTQQVRESATNAGYKRVQVFMKNYSDTPLRLLYRFVWTDMDGVEVTDPSHDAWEKETVVAGDDVVFTSIAPSKNCQDYKLRLRAAHVE